MNEVVAKGTRFICIRTIILNNYYLKECEYM